MTSLSTSQEFTDRVISLFLYGEGERPDDIADEYTTLDCPLMVRFSDINDPASIQKVDPKNLAASFGEGVELRSVRVEITDGPISTKVHKKLPWLKHVVKFEERPKNMGYGRAKEQGLLTFAMTMDSGYFIMGHENDR